MIKANYFQVVMEITNEDIQKTITGADYFAALNGFTVFIKTINKTIYQADLLVLAENKIDKDGNAYVEAKSGNWIEPMPKTTINLEGIH